MADRDRRNRRTDRGEGETPRRNRAQEQHGSPQKETLMDRVLKTKRKLEDQRSSYFVPKEGLNRVRIMPSWRGVGEDFYVALPEHRNIGPDKKGFAVCLQYWGDPCPICDAIERLSKSESARDQNAASDMMPRGQYMVNVGVPNEPDGLIKPWKVSNAFFLELLGFFTDGEYGDFTDPKEGFDLLFTRTGQGLKTRYTNKHLARKSTPVKIRGAKAKLINLDTFPRRHTRAQLRAMLRGEETD